MPNEQYILKSLSNIHKNIESLNASIWQVKEDVDSVQNNIVFFKTELNGNDSLISKLIADSVPYEWQIASVVISILSILITIFTCWYVRKIKISIKKGNNLSELRKTLILLKAKLEKVSNNRPMASDLFEHFCKTVAMIPDYMDDYDKHESLKKLVQKIIQSNSMGIMDCRTNIGLVLNEIGEMYVA